MSRNAFDQEERQFSQDLDRWETAREQRQKRPAPYARRRGVFLVEAFDLGCHLDFLLILTIVQAARRP